MSIQVRTSADNRVIDYGVDFNNLNPLVTGGAFRVRVNRDNGTVVITTLELVNGLAAGETVASFRAPDATLNNVGGALVAAVDAQLGIFYGVAPL